LSQNLVASTVLHADTADSSNAELMSRELATAAGAATQRQRTSTGTASESVYSTAGRDTFTSLDSSTGSGSTTLVHASAHEAEVGYQDPTLGWVGVKASMSGGAIHASVVPSSTEAAQSLNAQMSGLNTYLNEQHSSVSSLTLESPSGNAMSGSSQGSGQDNAQSSAQQTQQNSAVSSVLGSDSVSEDSTYERFNTGVSLRVPEGSSISVLV
jgi:flagellar hook-length control protein FliK